MLNDPTVRQALQAHLSSPSAILMHEVPIASSSARADIVTLDDHLTGYEIKSDIDSFSRFPSQMRCYGHVFDRIVIVTTERHREKALRLRPRGAGVMIAYGFPVVFRVERKPSRNRNQSTASLLDLLDLREIRSLARQFGLRGYSKSWKFQLIERIVREVPHEQCRERALATLRTRPHWNRGRA